MDLSRRQLLRGMAGATAALGVGGCAPPPRIIEGGIVGAPDEVGHLLRDGPPPRATRFTPVPILIVGGGVSGLSAGWRLARAGFTEYKILELAGRPGGNATSGEGPLCPHPWGAHYVPAPPPEATLTRLLFEELGVITGYDGGAPVFDERSTCFAPEERIFYKGDWYRGLYLKAGASAEDLAQWDRFATLVAGLKHRRGADGRRAFTIPLDLSSRDPELMALDEIPFDAWLDAQGFTSPRLRWMTDYACRDDYCARPHQISAWAGLHYYASRIMSADPDADDDPPTLTWPEGNGWLVRRLVEPQADRLTSARLVFDLTTTERGVEVSAVDPTTGVVEGHLAQRVVCCAPLFVAARMASPLRAAPPTDPRALRYGAWMVANLWVDERPAGRGAPPAWDNVLYDGQGVGYVAATHQRAEYRGPAVLTYYLPLTGDDDLAERRRLLSTPWEAWVDAALSDLRPAHPDLRPQVSRVDVMRWGHAMIRPRPGWLWGDRLAWQAASPGPIHLAHTDLALPLFEEAQHQGVRAAEAALRGMGIDAPTLAPWPGA